MVFISIPFKPQKRHSYDGYLFLQGVYSVGVTEVRSYFTQIIDHTSVTVHRIPTKLGTELRFNEPLKCVKFQPDWSTHWCFMVDFAKCSK